MTRRPPRCPDCGSFKSCEVIPSDPAALPNLAKQASLLGIGRPTDDDAIWECVECMRQFGDRSHRYRAHPPRSSSEWLDLIRTMLPPPIRELPEGELRGGNPLLVIARVGADKIQILEAGLDGRDPSRSRMRGVPFAEVSPNESSVRVAALIAAAWGKRISRYRWCPACKELIEPERMNVGKICDDCASAALGVLF